MPPSKMVEVIDLNEETIIGLDANARHTLWGSKTNNERGECFADFILSRNINICNICNFFSSII